MSFVADDRREKKLRQLAKLAGGTRCESQHVDEPLLALLRDGDRGDDIQDALLHVAQCVDCRARLTEGELQRTAVVVMAIEAPKSSQENLAKAFGDVNARLVERGNGRWTAVVAADKSQSLVKALEEDGGPVSRLAVTEPVDVPASEGTSARKPAYSLVDAGEFGTNAAEVQAWAQVSRAPKRKVAGPSPAWAAIGALAILGAVVVAYVLATR